MNLIRRGLAGLRLWRRRNAPPHVVALRAVQAFVQFFIQAEASAGIMLLASTLVALLWSNTAGSHSYEDFWSTRLSLDLGVFSLARDLRHWINDGLMTVFFFLFGLEIKRELDHGELADPRQARLPVLAALGGMAAPALIFTAFNAGHSGAKGWGIPMATDIAFSLGVLSLLGRRVPFGVEVFLLTLAVADDIGSIVVIALFYGGTISGTALGAALVLFALAVLMNRAGVRSIPLYTLVGVLAWLAMAKSGVTPTLIGVALGLLTPARPHVPAGAVSPIEAQPPISEPPLDHLERLLLPWVGYAIVPLFALANAGVGLSSDAVSAAFDGRVGLGVLIARSAGKLVGIVGTTFLLVRSGLCDLPAGAGWRHLVGVGMIASVGFTVPLFITDITFADSESASAAKIALFAASVVAGVAGYLWLRLAPPAAQEEASRR